MKKTLLLLWISLALMVSSSYATRDLQTIVIMRHGEKPWFGLGQLNCQGLNRSLLLASTLMQKYGKPDVIFAPDPKAALFEGTGTFNYVRPLATIEPLAIQLNMPVNTQYGFSEIDALAQDVLQEKYHRSLIFISWEHFKAYLLARNLMQLSGGSPWDVPFWYGSDYDSLYVINIDWQQAKVNAKFRHDYQALNGQSDICPTNHALNQATQQPLTSTAKQQTQTLIFIPAAEAQLPERGQLNCQGINRALHLIHKLSRLYPKIDRFIAADPIDKVYAADQQGYYYQRALMTLEPAAINAGQPVYTPYGYQQITAMTKYLKNEHYYNKTIAIAWSRQELIELVRNLYRASGGNILDIPTTLPEHDNMYVISVIRAGNKSQAQFKIISQDLNHQDTVCPAPI